MGQKRKGDNILRSIYAFRSVERKREPLKRGEGLQIASEAGRFTAAILLYRGIPKNVRRRFLGKRRSRRAGMADRLCLSACRLPRASSR